MNNGLTVTLNRNTEYLKKFLSEMTDDEMLVSTGESNTIGWIIGHIAFYRGRIAVKLNKECQFREIEKAFERGAPKNKNIKMNRTDALADFIARGEKIAEAINALGEEGLKEKIDAVIPGTDGTLEGYIAYLLWHEVFHLGQIDLIKAAAGKGGIK